MFPDKLEAEIVEINNEYVKTWNRIGASNLNQAYKYAFYKKLYQEVKAEYDLRDKDRKEEWQQIERLGLIL